jgi:TonB family protein
MALRALLFSKSPETTESMSAILKQAGMRVELCVDIFAAMEKGTKQAFSCVVVDWSEQPEAGFLLKRAREAGLNRAAVAIAIVGDEPTPEEEREHRLDFLVYRPIVADEAGAVLAKACQQMQVHSSAYAGNAGATLDKPEILEPSEPTLEDPDLVSIATELPDSMPHPSSKEGSEPTMFADPREGGSKYSFEFRPILAVVLVVIVAFFFWRSRDAFQYLSTTPEGALHVLKDSFAELFFVNKTGTQSVGTTMTDAQQDAYFARPAAKGNGQSTYLGVASADIGLPDGPQQLRPPYDFPLPTPELHVEPVATRPVRAPLPDSIRSSAPVARPVVLTANPQLVPVSTPPPTSTPAWQQAGEPVRLTEESARAMVLQSVNAVYPPEAMGQKLQGPVVLQVAIGRDGTVQELKLVRGYFVLAKAAIAAVRQWRFRPYNVNGRALETQTVITINFSYPPG